MKFFGSGHRPCWVRTGVLRGSRSQEIHKANFDAAYAKELFASVRMSCWLLWVSQNQ